MDTSEAIPTANSGESVQPNQKPEGQRKWTAKEIAKKAKRPKLWKCLKKKLQKHWPKPDDDVKQAIN